MPVGAQKDKRRSHVTLQRLGDSVTDSWLASPELCALSFAARIHARIHACTRSRWRNAKCQKLKPEARTSLDLEACLHVGQGIVVDGAYERRALCVAAGVRSLLPSAVYIGSALSFCQIGKLDTGSLARVQRRGRSLDRARRMPTCVGGL